MLGSMPFARVAGGLTVAGLLAGCNHVAAGDLPAHSSGLSGPRSVGQSPEQQANDQAHAALTNYYTLVNRLASTPDADPAQLSSVATADQIGPAEQMIDEQRRGGSPLTLLASRPTDYHIPKDPTTGGPTPGKASLDLDTCVRGVPDKAVSGDTAQEVRTTMENPQWPDPAGWRVAQTMHVPGAGCDDSPF
ncbi:hypothetical protein ACFYO1_01665 [Nocardia sp. NPDC006044]|uniref:hypothetical protein n=1 Tax=Nocardia sp. NPDC006044 TaxID=3364306 RepID=UPI00369F2BAA